ncbi:MAG: zinc ribbon domain-containing protein [Bacilli bacterium]|nr:zinc ribbon domain-containing protein [Bacilli bacterium]
MYNSNYNLVNGLDRGFEGIIAALGVFAIFLLILIIPVVVIYIIGAVKTYKKAGRQGWEAIVPFYNNWVYVEIANLNTWWVAVVLAYSIAKLLDMDDLVSLAALGSLFGKFVCNYNISKKLHKDTAFAVLMTLFPVVMIPLIGFSDSYTFDNDVELSKNGPFDDKKNDTTEPEKKKDTAKEKKDDKAKSSEKDSVYCPHCGAKISKDSKFCSKCGKEI